MIHKFHEIIMYAWSGLNGWNCVASKIRSWKCDEIWNRFGIAKTRKITTMGVMFSTDSLSKHASDRSRPMQEEDGIMCFQKLSLVTPVSDEEFGSHRLAGEFVLSCWALKKLRCQNGRRKRSGALPLCIQYQYNNSIWCLKTWGFFGVACVRVESLCFSKLQ